MKALPERFWPKVQKGESCWLWTGHLDRHGYGRVRRDGRSMALAHRVAYEFLRGPIPKGLDLDHLCRNRACVRPDHLEAVTRRVNLARGEGFNAQNLRKERCPRGHAYDEENTYRRANGSRSCRKCHAALERARAKRERLLAARGGA